MFLDLATIFVKAGNGGDGIVSFYTEKYVPNGGPDGGDGGKGGDIIFVNDNSSSTLIDFKFKKHFRADSGDNGSSKRCKGRSASDLVIKVPRGTVIKDKKSGKIICDMFEESQTYIIQKGGLGGKGNSRFATAERKAPRFAQKGEKTDELELLLELKTIADVGLVGFPNVGKSTTLSVVSGARPKIANYHFTTLNPNLGVVEYYDSSFVLADIPGLIEGASQGAGLGHHFLRHIERVRLIVHIVDISGIEGRDPYEDYITINNELNEYSEKLANLPQIVCANKYDLLEDKSKLAEFETKIGKKVYPISAITKMGLDDVLKDITVTLKDLPPISKMEYEEFIFEGKNKTSFWVTKANDGSFIVEGGLIDELARNVVLSDYESFRYFQKMLKDKHVISRLVKEGAKKDDIVRIKDIEFEFVD